MEGDCQVLSTILSFYLLRLEVPPESPDSYRLWAFTDLHEPEDVLTHCEDSGELR